MKRVVKKVVSLAIVSILVMGCLAGCGAKGSGGKKKGDSKTIEIAFLQQGLGIEWFEAIIKGFEAKYPEYTVQYTTTSTTATLKATYGLEDTDSYDLYLGQKNYDTSHMEPLNDVLEATVEGESKSIKEKFNQAYLDLENKDGNYYMLTYGGGIIGFVYNKKIFKEAGIDELPRTTDELIMICDDLSDANVKPLCHFNSDGYYTYMNQVWWAQYDGLDAWTDFYKNPSKDKMLAKDGRYEVIKVHESLNNPDNVLIGSNSEAHVTMQTKFLDGQSAMMVNGSWLSSEMKNVKSVDNFAMMKTPVISAITDKLTTVKTERELRALITAIDNVTDGKETIDTYKDGENYKVNEKSVSAADWEYVKTARNMMPANYAGISAYIPTYSNAKEGAKEFLKYLYSDEGYKIFADTLHIEIPFSLSEGTIDTSKWNPFEQNQAELIATSETMLCNLMMDKHNLFIDGGAEPFVNHLIVNGMCAQSQKDRHSADEAWEKITGLIKDRYDNMWMANIQ